MKIAHSHNIVLRTISILNNNEFVAVSSKYDIISVISLNVSLSRIFGLHLPIL